MPDVSLLCRLGRHRPRGKPRWNDGYYFATCERCGADLVRTAFERWHVPSGYRVVWSDRPPASRPDVALVAADKGAPTPGGLGEGPAEPAYGSGEPAAVGLAEPVHDPLPDSAAPPAPSEAPVEAPAPPDEASGIDERLPVDAPSPPSGSRSGRLPIEDVLAQLNAEDRANRPPETAPAPLEVPAQRRRSTWDFMDDDSFKAGPVAASSPMAGIPAHPPAAGSRPDPDSGKEEARASAPAGHPGGERAREIRSALRDFWSGPGEPRPILVVALAFAVAVAVALALAIPSATSPSGDPVARRAGVGEAPDPFATDASFAAPEAEEAGRQQAQSAGAESPADRGYVVASLLSCRDAPVLQARRVRNLARGQEVRVLAIEGDWASLTYRGGQCWAQARYISPVPPL